MANNQAWWKKMILDVGCGTKPKGDVNTDVDYCSHDMRKAPIDVKQIRNFVLCDGQYLPFKPKTFSKVYCHHVIEHVENPLQLLAEVIRVSNGTVEVKCPHRFSRDAKRDPTHRSFFTVTWFKRTLSKLGVSFKIEVSLRNFPHTLIPILQLPNEITVSIVRK